MKWSRLIGFGLSATAAFAHGPLDHSANLTLGAERIEATVVLGPDPAEAFFKSAGLPRPQPAGRGVDLSSAALARLFELVAEGQPLLPISARVATDGLEYRFSGEYAAAPRTPLEFHALYLELSASMPAGALVARTEAGATIFATVLSRTNAVGKIELPVALTKPVAPRVAVPTASPAIAPPELTAANVPLAPTPPLVRTELEPRSPAGSSWLIAGVAVVLVAAWVMARRVR